MATPSDHMTRGAWHAFLVLAAAILFLVAASPTFTIIYANSTAGQLRAQLMASCAFAGDLGGVPLPASPKPSKLGVSLLMDSRHQWRALHCPGTLPPPSPGLVKWGRFYRIPVS